MKSLLLYLRRYGSLTRPLVVIAASGVLLACTSLAPVVASLPQLPWKSQQATWQALKVWDLAAKVNISHLNESWHFRLGWQQWSAQYRLWFLSPLGNTLGELRTVRGGVLLTAKDARVYHAASPEALLEQHLQLQVPVSQLVFWIKGLPAPGPYQLTKDAFARPQQLKQAGWTIQYKSYAVYQGVVLPRMIRLQRGDWVIKLVINTWQIGDNKSI